MSSLVRSFKGAFGRSAIFMLLGLIVLYFFLAAIQGKYGLITRMQVNAEALRLEEELATLTLQRTELQNKTQRLQSKTIDLDLLDERARHVLGMARSDEMVIR